MSISSIVDTQFLDSLIIEQLQVITINGKTITSDMLGKLSSKAYGNLPEQIQGCYSANDVAIYITDNASLFDLNVTH